MSEFLPMIGEHDVVEVYEYYNRPFLLSVRNRQEELYVLSLADETEEEEVWLAAPMTEEQRWQLEQGELPLRTVFTTSPTGVLRYSLRFGADVREDRVQVVTDLTTLEEYLPTPSYRLIRAKDSPKGGKP